jgi:hypothetical protein
MDNHIQVRLFSAISKKFKNQAKAINDYRLRFPGIGQSTARARFTGINSITYEHGMEVAAAYRLHDWDIWPEGWPHTSGYAEVPNPGENIGLYLDMLNQDLLSISKNTQSRLHVAINDMPFILLKQYRALVGFSLYCSLSLEMNHSTYRQFRFGDAFMQEAQVSFWLDQCRQALGTYQKIQGVEYWSPYMLQPLVQKIKLVKTLGLFEAETVVQRLQEELEKLVNDLETKAHSGKKLLGPLTEGAPVKIFNHAGIVTDTLIIAEVNDDLTPFGYEVRGLSHLQRLGSASAQAKLKAIKNVGYFGGTLGSAFDKTFFSQLRQCLVA